MSLLLSHCNTLIDQEKIAKKRKMKPGCPELAGGPPSTQGRVKSGQELEVTVWDGTEYKEKKRKPVLYARH